MPFSTGYNSDDQEDYEDPLPAHIEERASTNLRSPEFQEPAPEPQAPAPAPTSFGTPMAGMLGGFSVPEEQPDVFQSETQPAQQVSAPSAPALTGAESPDVNTALSQLGQEPEPLPPPRPGYEDNWIRAQDQMQRDNTRQQSGIHAYLKSKGVETEILPDGSHSISLNEDGSPRWKPETSQPFQDPETGRWMIRSRDDRGQMKDVDVLGTKGLVHTDRQTGARYLIGPDKQPIDLGSPDPSVIARNEVARIRSDLYAREQSASLRIQDMRANLEPAKLAYRQLQAAAATSSDSVGGRSQSVRQLENVLQNLRPGIEAGTADDDAKQRYQAASEAMDNWHQDHPEYGQLRNAIDSGESEINRLNGARLQDRSRRLMLAADPRTPAAVASLLPDTMASRGEQPAPGDADPAEVAHDAALQAARQQTTQAKALPDVLRQLKGAGLQTVGGRPIDEAISAAINPPARPERVTQAETAAQSADGDTMRGLKTSLHQIPMLGKGAAALIGATGEKVLGDGGVSSAVKNWGLKGYAASQAEESTTHKDTDELTTAWKRFKGGDVGAMADWLQYSAGYLVGQAGEAVAVSILGSLVGAAVGAPTGPGAVGTSAAGAVTGLVAKGAVKTGIRDAVEYLVKKEAMKLVAEQAEKQGLKLTTEALAEKATEAGVRKQAVKMIGRDTALMANSLVQEGGSIYPEAVEQAHKEGRELNGSDMAKVWATTILAAKVDKWGDALGLDAALGKNLAGGSSQLKRVGLSAATIGGKEGAGEVAQTFLERVGAGQSLADQEAQDDYVNSGAVGLLGGGVTGSASAAIHSRSKGGPSRPQSLSQSEPVDGGASALPEQGAPSTPSSPGSGGPLAPKAESSPSSPQADAKTVSARLKSTDALSAEIADAYASDNNELAASLQDERAGQQSALHSAQKSLTSSVPEGARARIASIVGGDAAANEAHFNDQPDAAFVSAHVGQALRDAYVGPEQQQALERLTSTLGEHGPAAQFVADQHVGMQAAKDLVAIATGQEVPAERVAALGQLGLVEQGEDGPMVTHDATPLLPRGLTARLVQGHDNFRVTSVHGEKLQGAAAMIRGGQAQLENATHGRAMKLREAAAPKPHLIRVEFNDRAGNARVKVLSHSAGTEEQAIAEAAAKFQKSGARVTHAEVTTAEKERERTAAPTPAPAKPAPAKPANKIATPREALAVVRREFQQNRQYLAALGITRMELVAHPEGHSGLAVTREGALQVDGERLKAQSDALDSRGTSLADWLHLALMGEGKEGEEVWHSLQFKALDQAGVSPQEHYAAIREEAEAQSPDLLAAAREAYEDFDTLPAWKQGAEMERMVLQRKWTGTITERIFKSIEHILDFLRGLKIESPLLKESIARVEAVRDAALKEARTSPQSGQTSEPTAGRVQVDPNPPQSDARLKEGDPSPEPASAAQEAQASVVDSYRSKPTSDFEASDLQAFQQHGERNGAKVSRVFADARRGSLDAQPMTDKPVGDPVEFWIAETQQGAVAIKAPRTRAELKRAQAIPVVKEGGQWVRSQQVTFLDVSPGDQVQVGTETMKVVSVDPANGSFVLEDGKKYGVQEVEGHIFGKLKQAEDLSASRARRDTGTPDLFDRNPVVEYLSLQSQLGTTPAKTARIKTLAEAYPGGPAALTAAAADLQTEQAREKLRAVVKQLEAKPSQETAALLEQSKARLARLEEIAPQSLPKLRTGENQGDLLQGKDAPFNLVGEKGIDGARVVSDREQYEQDQLEAQRNAERDQAMLFASRATPKQKEADRLEKLRATRAGFAAELDAGKSAGKGAAMPQSDAAAHDSADASKSSSQEARRAEIPSYWDLFSNRKSNFTIDGVPFVAEIHPVEEIKGLSAEEILIENIRTGYGGQDNAFGVTGTMGTRGAIQFYKAARSRALARIKSAPQMGSDAVVIRSKEESRTKLYSRIFSDARGLFDGVFARKTDGDGTVFVYVKPSAAEKALPHLASAGFEIDRPDSRAPSDGAHILTREQGQAVQTAYRALVQEQKFPAVAISELADRSGIPLEKLKQQLLRSWQAGNVVLSSGDWSLSSEKVREGAVYLPGQDQQHERPMTQVRLLDKSESLSASRAEAAAQAVSRFWREVAEDDTAFVFPKTSAREPSYIARDMSIDGREMTGRHEGDEVVFSTPTGELTIENADTSHPVIYAVQAGSAGRPMGGGAQLYQAALAWAHNNGKTIHPSNALTPINKYVRRTSNMLSSALRFDTTEHMLPDPGQQVPWKLRDDNHNIGQLAIREMNQVFAALPELRRLTFDFGTSTMRDEHGAIVTPAQLAAHLQSGPEHSFGLGIGRSTAQRAILTRSALLDLEQEAVGGTAGRPEGRGSRVAVDGPVLYASKANADPDAARREGYRAGKEDMKPKVEATREKERERAAAAKQAIRDKAAAKQAALKQTMSGMVSKATAYKEVLRKAQQAGAAGVKRGTADTRAQLEQLDRGLWGDMQLVKQQMVDLVQAELPPEERGHFLSQIANLAADRPSLRGNPDRVWRAAGKLAGKILQHAEEVHRKDLVEEIEKVRKRADDSPNVAVDYKARLARALHAFSFTKLSSGKRAELESRRAFVEQQRLAGNPLNIPRAEMNELNRLHLPHILDLSTPALLALRDEVSELEERGRQKWSGLEGARERRVAREIGEVASLKPGEHTVFNERAPIKAQPPGSPDDPGGLKLSQKLKNAATKAFNYADLLGKAMMPMNALLEVADGSTGRYDGLHFKVIKGPLDLAHNRTLVGVNETMAPLEEAVKKHNLKEGNFQRIGTVLTALQEGGTERLRLMGITPERVTTIEKSLSPGEREYIAEWQKIANTLGPQVAKMMREQFNQSVTLMDNYFPLSRDQHAFEQDAKAKPIDAESGVPLVQTEFGTWQFVKKDFNPRPTAKTAQGFTIERQPGAATPVKINAHEVISQHVTDLHFLLNTQADLIRIKKVVASSEYAQKFGAEMRDLMMGYIDVVARQGGVDSANRNRALDMLRRNTSIGLIAFRFGSQLQNLSALPFAFHHAGGVDAFLRGVKEVNSAEGKRFIAAHLAETLERQTSEPAQQEVIHGKITEAGFFLARWLDRNVAQSTAMGRYLGEMARKGYSSDVALNPVDPKRATTPAEKQFAADAEEALRVARVRMQRAVSSSHHKDAALALSRGVAFGGNVSIARSLLQFKGDALNRLSNFTVDLWRAGILKNRDPKSAILITTALLASAGISVALRHSMRHLTNALTGFVPKKDEDSLEKQFLLEVLRSNPAMDTALQMAMEGRSGIGTLDVPTQAAHELYMTPEAKTGQKQAQHAVRGIAGVAASLGAPGSGYLGELIAKVIGGGDDNEVKRTMRENDIKRAAPAAGPVRKDVVASVRAGEKPQDAMKKAVADGMKPEQARSAVREGQRPADVVAFERLPLQTAIEVYRRAQADTKISPEIKKQWRQILQRKHAAAKDLVPA